jgi:hypothetical protein
MLVRSGSKTRRAAHIGRLFDIRLILNSDFKFEIGLFGCFRLVTILVLIGKAEIYTAFFEFAHGNTRWF